MIFFPMIVNFEGTSPAVAAAVTSAREGYLKQGIDERYLRTSHIHKNKEVVDRSPTGNIGIRKSHEKKGQKARE